MRSPSTQCLGRTLYSPETGTPRHPVTASDVSTGHTDLNFAKEVSMPDLFPSILGHEGAGIVERVGAEVNKVAEGDHVIVVFSCCGECKYCLRKESSYCDVWFQYNFGIGRLDGSKTFSDPSSGKRITSHFFGQSSFAKHILVSQNGLVKVDKAIPFEKLAPLGCGIMTGAGGEAIENYACGWY
jgi:aryl-alcohol dehydrogenase